MKLRLIGLATGLFALLADQASKQWLLYGFGLEERQPVHLTPFLELILRWNTGISYSLFTNSSTAGRYALLGVTLVAVLALIWWLWRTTSALSAVALGLLIGGALGNAYDRYAYGAVEDFVHFYVDGFSWYVFNGADVAITLGVIILIYESFLAPRPQPASKLP